MVDKEKCRLVATGLTGLKNKEILSSVLGQLSDGIWENSPRMEAYWRFMKAVMAEDGTVFIQVSTEPSQFISYRRRWLYNKMYNVDEMTIREFFANKLKYIVKEAMKWEKEKLGQWKRDNDKVFNGYIGDTVPISVADTYAAYDALKGRKPKAA